MLTLPLKLYYIYSFELSGYTFLVASLFSVNMMAILYYLSWKKAKETLDFVFVNFVVLWYTHNNKW